MTDRKLIEVARVRLLTVKEQQRLQAEAIRAIDQVNLPSLLLALDKLRQ